jgi:hypothetical protein
MKRAIIRRLITIPRFTENHCLPSFRAFGLTKRNSMTTVTPIQIMRPVKEDIMVQITESASKQIAEYFKGKEVSPIRIFLNEGG